MERIGLLWFESEFQLQSERESPLWNALRGVTTELIALCREKKAEPEAAWKQTQELFEQFQLDKYDEIVLIDGSMVGPFYPLEEMFVGMSPDREGADEESLAGQADFWGLIRNAPAYTPQKEKRPEHIDPRFLVLRRNVYDCLKSLTFYEMIYKMAYKGSRRFSQAKERTLSIQIAFVHALELSGYRGAAYSDMEVYRNNRNCNNFVWYEGKAYELVKEKKCPLVPAGIFAKKNFFSDDGYDARKLFEYVTKRLHFSEDYLWEKLLRCFNISDIYMNHHMDYVLSKEHTDFQIKERKAAVIIHIYYIDLLDGIMRFMESIPAWMDIYITTSIEENIGKIEEQFVTRGIRNYHIIKVRNRGRDCSALLVGCREIIPKYEYICFIHDKKTSGNNGACTIGERFMDSLFENLLGSKAYLSNIMGLFEENPHLGLVAPPIPVHGQYFCLKENAWTCCFDETRKLADKIGLPVKINEEKQPFILSTSFWCRTKALEPLWRYPFVYEDFCAEPMPEDGTISHAIERILPYVAQTQGFYSAIVMTAESASLQISNLNYQLMGAVQKLRGQYAISSFANFENADFDKMLAFCKRYERIYIYGTGLYGKKYAEILVGHQIPYAGFVVTKKNSTDKVMEHDVYALGELLETEHGKLEEIGLLVAVSVYYQEEISEMLEREGIYQYYIV